MKELIRTYAEGILAGVVFSLLFALPIVIGLYTDDGSDPVFALLAEEDIPGTDPVQEAALAGELAAAIPRTLLRERYLAVGEEAVIGDLITVTMENGEDAQYLLETITGPDGTAVVWEERDEELVFTPLLPGSYYMELLLKDPLGRGYPAGHLLLANRQLSAEASSREEGRD